MPSVRQLAPDLYDEFFSGDFKAVVLDRYPLERLCLIEGYPWHVRIQKALGVEFYSGSFYLRVEVQMEIHSKYLRMYPEYREIIRDGLPSRHSVFTEWL